MPTRIADRPRLSIFLVALFAAAACDDTSSSDEAPTSTGTSIPVGGSSSTSADDSTVGESTSDSEADDEGSTAGPELEDIPIAGDYTDDFGGSHSIGLTEWTSDYGDGPFSLTYVAIDTEAQWVAGEEGEDGTYGRYDWTVGDDGNVYYCTASFGATNIEAAIEAPLSDPTDLDVAGCGGMFPWTRLSAGQ